MTGVRVEHDPTATVTFPHNPTDPGPELRPQKRSRKGKERLNTVHPISTSGALVSFLVYSLLTFTQNRLTTVLYMLRLTMHRRQERFSISLLLLWKINPRPLPMQCLLLRSNII